MPRAASTTPVPGRRSLLLAGLGAALGAPAVRAASTPVVGLTLPLSGRHADTGADLRDGIAAALKQHANTRVELQLLDDRGEPAVAAENVRKLAANPEVLALLSPYGTATALAIQPVVDAQKLPVIGAVTGSDALRDSKSRWIFHLRASAMEEADAVVTQLDHLGVDQIGVLFLQDGTGREGAEGARLAIVRLALPPTGIVGVKPDLSDLTPAFEKLIKAGSDAIILIGDETLAVAAAKAAATRSPKPRLIATSDAMSPSLPRQLGALARGFGVSQVMPQPWQPTSAFVRDYQAGMREVQAKDYSYRSIEGYAAGRAFCEALHRAGNAPTRERLVAALEGAPMDFGGLRLRFGPQLRRGNAFVELTVLTDNGRVLR